MAQFPAGQDQSFISSFEGVAAGGGIAEHATSWRASSPIIAEQEVTLARYRSAPDASFDRAVGCPTRASPRPSGWPVRLPPGREPCWCWLAGPAKLRANKARILDAGRNGAAGEDRGRYQLNIKLSGRQPGRSAIRGRGGECCGRKACGRDLLAQRRSAIWSTLSSTMPTCGGAQPG